MSIEQAIQFIRDNQAYVSLTIMPDGHNSIYISWWDEEKEKYGTIIDGDDLGNLLDECTSLIDRFQHGDRAGWFTKEETESDECLILK